MATFITSKTVGQDITISVETSTGFWKYNHDGTDSSVFANGSQTITVANANGEFTLISCLSDGTISGDITYLALQNNQITSFDGTGLSSLLYLYLMNNQLTTFDGTDLGSLEDLDLFNNLLTSFDGTGLINLTGLGIQNNQLTSIDISNLNLLHFLYIDGNPSINNPSVNNTFLAKLAANEEANNWNDGSLSTTGGRTSAGTIDYDYLIANGWYIEGADLVPTGTGKLRVKGVGQL